MTRSIKLLGLVLVAWLALSACGGDDDAGGSDTTTGAAGAQEGGQDDDGSGDVASSTDFWIAAPEGIEGVIFEMAGVDGTSGQRHLAYTQDDFDRVVAFYDNWTSGQDPAWIKSEESGVVSYLRLSGGETSMIAVNADFDDPGLGLITFVITSGTK